MRPRLPPSNVRICSSILFEKVSIPNFICGGPTASRSFFWIFKLNRPFFHHGFVFDFPHSSVLFSSSRIISNRIYRASLAFFGVSWSVCGLGAFFTVFLFYFPSHVVCSKCDRMEVSEKRFIKKRFRRRKNSTFVGTRSHDVSHFLCTIARDEATRWREIASAHWLSYATSARTVFRTVCSLLQ